MSAMKNRMQEWPSAISLQVVARMTDYLGVHIIYQESLVKYKEQKYSCFLSSKSHAVLFQANSLRGLGLGLLKIKSRATHTDYIHQLATPAPDTHLYAWDLAKCASCIGCVRGHWPLHPFFRPSLSIPSYFVHFCSFIDSFPQFLLMLPSLSYQEHCFKMDLAGEQSELESGP